MDIDIATVATLARLDLAADEAKELAGQLGSILDYVQQLDELDTTDVPPTSHAVPLDTPFRDDIASPPLPRDDALAVAPRHDGSAYLVPDPAAKPRD